MRNCCCYFGCNAEMGRVRREEKGKKLMGNEKRKEGRGSIVPKGKVTRKNGSGGSKRSEKDFLLASSIGRK